ETAVLLLGEDDPAVTGHVLTADDRSVLDDPLTAALVLGGVAVPGLGGHLPTVERFPVEDFDEPVVVELLRFGQIGARREQDDERYKCERSERGGTHGRASTGRARPAQYPRRAGRCPVAGSGRLVRSLDPAAARSVR